MKRFICALFIALTLCGCSDNRSQIKLDSDSLNTSFSADIEGNVYKGYIYLDKGMNMIITMLYPDLVKGISYTFCSDTVISSVDNVNCVYKFNDLPESFVFLKLYNAIINTADSIFVKKSDSEYEAVSDGITLITDKNGKLISAGFKDSNIRFG